jgi:hypothetical protein
MSAVAVRAPASIRDEVRAPSYEPANAGNRRRSFLAAAAPLSRWYVRRNSSERGDDMKNVLIRIAETIFEAIVTLVSLVIARFAPAS